MAEILRLKEILHGRFIADPVSPVRRTLFGGQVAAQALRAASLTVPDDRTAHSLHAYFLAAGDASAPIVFTVERDRDGGRYSGRRVTAHQGDSVILSLSCSFSRPTEGATEFQAATMPAAQPPDGLATYELNPLRTFDLQARVPDDPDPYYRWPARLWLRISEPLDDDPNLRACGVVFLSDLCTGLTRMPQCAETALLTSLDHAVWLHRDRDPNEWLLVDLHPVATSAGRGVYSGQIYDQRGTLAASLTQESLFDRVRIRQSNT
ncbi:acyl-CoA thioesterase [Mycolicibacterium vaccae]|uniref:acyl-CoA thioesterase n=1 Tax=Mycolicibacterium vaccae TaxID=1810 RepID=UPI003D02333B